MNSSSVKWGFALAVLLGLVVAVYAPGLEGPFLFDDRENITTSPSLKMRTLDPDSVRNALFAWGEWYPHRGLARLSFALNYYFAGQRFDRFAFKLTNVVIHVLNGLLVYWLSVLLLRRYAGGARPPTAEAGWSAMQSYLPLVVSALWLLHPIQLTGVLYVVQRMTSMAAFFVLLGLVVFVVGRIRLESGRAHGMTLMLAGLAGGVGLGFFCKQNAVLLPFYAFLVELFFFRHEALGQAARRRLYGFYGLTVALPVVLAVAGLIFAWDVIAEDYVFRDFTPWERLLTQSRVLFFYLGLLVFPHIRAFGLYHDDFTLSTGWLEPWTTLVAVGLWVGLVGLALWGVRRRALWSFGLLWYLVGHSLESSLVALELVFEHRNYVPSLGVLFAAAYYLVWALERVSSGRRLAYPVVGLLVVVLAFTTFTRASNWGNRLTVFEFSLRNHPNSTRTHGEYARVTAQYTGNMALAYKHWTRAAELDPSSVLELVEMEKVLAMRILAFENQDDGAVDAKAGLATPDHFATPMAPDLEYLKALERVVGDEVTMRLETRPITMSNVAALRTLRRCIQKKFEKCVRLYPRAIEWFEIALENPRVKDHVRAVLQLALAKLYASRGEIDKAVVNAEAAARGSPGEIHYQLELALMYLKLDDLDAAGRAIAEAESNVSLSGFGSADVQAMKSRLEKARRQKNASRP
jgi:tetratricopeptide (TPR) repeat protein